MSSSIQVRTYRDGDAITTREVFLLAVRETASADYSPAQIAAWTQNTRERSEGEWNRARLVDTTFVATVGEQVVGFAAITDAGFITMMFVHPEYARCGVGAALLDQLLAHARETLNTRVSTHASETARPFLAQHGFQVDDERHRILHGIELKNYSMSSPV